MNFLQISRVSFDRVAENIITCLSCGVPRKISWTSRRISEKMSDLTNTVVQFWKTPARDSFKIVPRCDGTYQGHQAFCHIHREQSVWYFSSSMIGRGSKPWGDLELRRQYEVDSPSMFSCPCRLAYHRKIQQPKREAVSSGGQSGVHVDQAVRGSLKWTSTYLEIFHVFWKSLIFFWDLKSEFTSVAHDQHLRATWVVCFFFVQLLQCC